MLFLVIGPLPLAVVSALVFGPLSGWLAGRADRSPYLWFLYGVVSGPVALLLVVLAPPGRCRACMSATAGWRSACPACGLDARTGLPPTQVTTRAAIAVPAPEAEAGAASPETPAAEVSPTPAFSLKRPGARASPVAPRPVEAISPAGHASPATVEAAPTRTRTEATATARAVGHPRLIGRAAPVQIELLATGVYHGGSERLVLGYRYMIGRHEHQLLVLGPLHETPNTVRVERPLAQLDVYSEEGVALITAGAGEGNRMLTLRFVAVAGMSDRSLEEALIGRGETEAATSTAAPTPVRAATGTGEAQTTEGQGAPIPAGPRIRVARASATRQGTVEPQAAVEPVPTVEPQAAVDSPRRAESAPPAAMASTPVTPASPIATPARRRTRTVTGAAASPDGNGPSPGRRRPANNGPAPDRLSAEVPDEPAARGSQPVPGRRTKARS